MMYYGAYAREKRIWRLQRMILFTSAIISTGKTEALLTQSPGRHVRKKIADTSCYGTGFCLEEGRRI